MVTTTIHDGDLGPLRAHARYLRESGREPPGVALLWEMLADQEPDSIARDLSVGGELDSLIRSLSSGELVRVLVRLADLLEAYERQGLHQSAAMVSLVQDRVQDEKRSQRVVL